MQQSPRLCFVSVNSLPLGDRNLLCPVATPEPRKSVLKHSRRMLEQILIFGAFCANIETHLLLMKGIIVPKSEQISLLLENRKAQDNVASPS